MNRLLLLICIYYILNTELYRNIEPNRIYICSGFIRLAVNFHIKYKIRCNNSIWPLPVAYVHYIYNNNNNNCQWSLWMVLLWTIECNQKSKQWLRIWIRIRHSAYRSDIHILNFAETEYWKKKKKTKWAT